MTPPLYWHVLSSDLSAPGVIWQLAAIAASIVLAMLSTRLALRLGQERRPLLAQGVAGEFMPVLWPIVALAFLGLAKIAFFKWQAAPLLKVALAVLGALALVRLVFYLLRRIFPRSGNAGGMLFALEKVFAAVVSVGLGIYLTGLWPDVIAYLEYTYLPIGRHKTSLLLILQAVVSIGATLILALWLGAVLEERLMKVGTIHSSARLVMARAGRASLILVAVLLSLSLAGIDLTVLSVFGGALGVGIGLGLQKIVSSYVSGFVILLERSLAVGDMISVPPFYGLVTQINARYTVIRSLDGIETLVPNDLLISGAIQNHSLTDRRSRLATHFTVAYRTDVEALLPKLVDAVRDIARVCKDPAPHALLTGFGVNGLEVELGFWIDDPENGKGNLLSTVNRAVWRVLNEESVSIPYSQHEIRMASSDSEAVVRPELSSIKQ